MITTAFIEELLLESAQRERRAAVLERIGGEASAAIAKAARETAQEQREAACDLMMREWILILEARGRAA